MSPRFQLTEDAALSPERRPAPGARRAGRAPGARDENRGRPTTSAEALLFATVEAADGGPAALLDAPRTTLIGRLLEQLGSLGVRRAWVVTRPAWKAAIEQAAVRGGVNVTVLASESVGNDLRLTGELAGRARGPLLIGNAHVLTHRQALAGLLADPRIVSGVLANGSAVPDLSFPIRSRRARLVGAASAYHRVARVTGYFLGLMKVDARDRDRLVATAGELAELAADRPERWDAELERKTREWRLHAWRAAVERETGIAPDPAEAPAADSLELDSATEADIALRRRVAADDPLPLLLVGLVRANVELFPSSLRGFFYATPLSTQAAALAVDDLHRSDEDRALLQSAVKANDGFFTTYFVSPYSKYIARFAARRGWTPNAVSTASFAVGLAAAASFALGSRAGLVAGAILLQISFTIDCVDGQLARYTRTFSKLGAWLDSVFDRTKEYIVYAGLAVGAARVGQDVWLLAAAALTLQTARHMSAFAYVATRRQAIASTTPPPLEQPEDGPVSESQGARKAPIADVDLRPGLAPRAVRVAAAIWRSSLLRWGKRIVALPIGERFALISLTAAVWTPRVTFIALLAWGGVAAAYALSVRLLLSFDVPRRLVSGAPR